MKKNIVVLAPSPYSLYTICVTEMLRRNDVLVSAIVVRNLFNVRRFFNELSRDGNRLVKKIWKNLCYERMRIFRDLMKRLSI